MWPLISCPVTGSPGYVRRLSHPVIDADGHLAEFMPMVIDCMREVADDAVAERFIRFRRSPFTSGEGYLPDAGVLREPAHARSHDGDAAEAAVPAFGGDRPRLRVAVPHLGAVGLEQPRRRAAPGGGAGAEHLLRAGVRRVPRPARAGRGDPDVQSGGGGGRARLRRRYPRPQGGGDERDGAAHGSSRRLGRRRGWTRSATTVSTTTTRCGHAAWSSEWCPRSTASATGGGAGCRRRTTSTTTWATSPPRRRRRAVR